MSLAEDSKVATMNETNTKSTPSLFEVFEKNLLQSTQIDVQTVKSRGQSEALNRDAFIRRTVQDYAAVLRRSNVVIPQSLEAAVMEEWAEQVSQMLLKKTYGFASIIDYQIAYHASNRSLAKLRSSS